MLSYDVVEWGKPLEKTERETPEPRGTEVLLKLKYCGVCHSDVHIRDGYFDLGGGKRLAMSERGISLPATLGHEPHGTVVAAGPDAGDVAIGEDRLVYPWTGCGGCSCCREGLDNFCMAARCVGLQRPGGYADHLLVPHPRYLIDAGGIDPAWAATLSCSGLSTYAAVSKLNPIPPDEWVAVIGAGGLGLSAVSILRAIGHQRIVAVDIDAAKLNAAETPARRRLCMAARRTPWRKSSKSPADPYTVRWIWLALPNGDLRSRGSPQRRPADPRRSLRRGNSAVAGGDDSTRSHDPFAPRQHRRVEAGRRARARGQTPAHPDPKAAVVGSQPHTR